MKSRTGDYEIGFKSGELAHAIDMNIEANRMMKAKVEEVRTKKDIQKIKCQLEILNELGINAGITIKEERKTILDLFRR